MDDCRMYRDKYTVSYISRITSEDYYETIAKFNLQPFDVAEMLEILELDIDQLNIDQIERVYRASDTCISYFVSDCVNGENIEVLVEKNSPEYYKLKEVLNNDN